MIYYADITKDDKMKLKNLESGLSFENGLQKREI